MGGGSLLFFLLFSFIGVWGKFFFFVFSFIYLELNFVSKKNVFLKTKTISFSRFLFERAHYVLAPV